MDNETDEAYEADGFFNSSENIATSPHLMENWSDRHRCQVKKKLLLIGLICKDSQQAPRTVIKTYLDLIPKIQPTLRSSPPSMVPCIFPTSEESCCWFREVDKIQGITSTLTAWPPIRHTNFLERGFAGF